MFGSSDRVAAGLMRLQVVLILVLALSLLVLTGSLQAQEKPAVQELTGHLKLNEAAFYVLRHLKKGRSSTFLLKEPPEILTLPWRCSSLSWILPRPSR